MKSRIRALVGVIAATVVISVSSAEEYDLVINNGRVMDPETRYDSIANVGISAGRIAVITQDKISGKQTIDATGHVVAPGFIDTHWHYDRPWSNKLALRGGVPGSQPFEMRTPDIHVHRVGRSRSLILRLSSFNAARNRNFPMY